MLTKYHPILFQSHEDYGTWKIGQVHLPTGKIVACDPLTFSEPEPLALSVPPGTYPVILVEDIEFRSFAFAMIRFSDMEPVSWELALMQEEKAEELEDDEFFGYPVDAGLGCFMDLETAKKFLAREEDLQNRLGDSFDNLYTHEIAAILEENNEKWADYHIHEGQPENCIMFASGFGDGIYPSYWGKDANGNICCLVTDFLILEEDADE